jgi:hypothetical protein
MKSCTFSPGQKRSRNTSDAELQPEKTVTEFVIRHIKIVSIGLNLTEKTGVIAATAQSKPEFQAAQQEQRDENHGKKPHQPQPMF